MVKRITISMDEDLYEKIEEELEYGDSMSKWMREAVKIRFGVDGEAGNAKNAKNAMGGMAAD